MEIGSCLGRKTSTATTEGSFNDRAVELLHSPEIHRDPETVNLLQFQSQGRRRSAR
jgi:hypothetical protein